MMFPAADPAAAHPALRPAPAIGIGAAKRVRSVGATRLVLFVGEAVRPDSDLGALLARDGIRCLCLPGTEQAERAASLARFDAVVVDGALVDGPASVAIARVSAAHRCPLVVLGERPDEVDEIVALEQGASLFLARPLGARRLRAHLAALLRRAAPVATERDLGNDAATDSLGELAGWQFDPVQGALRRGAEQIQLTPGQAALLQCLLQAEGRLVPRGRLLAALPHGERIALRSLDVHLHRLRHRLREQGAAEIQVEAVRGRGYVLRAPAAAAR
jgi:DNA-binding response OmpR family regulator